MARRHGPPGTAKTMLARVVAGEAKARFVAVQGPELLSKYVGETEARVRDVFKAAREASPCVLFFDEIDGLLGVASQRGRAGYGDRLLSQFLVEMDGVAGGRVLVIAATNRPDLLDAALLRPGRFDRLLYIGLPDQKAREEILALAGARGDVAAWAARLDGYSGAEIVGIWREAAFEALRSGGEPSAFFDAKIASAPPPQTDAACLALHEAFQHTHRSQAL